MSGLTNGTAYTFEMRAVNSVGQGAAGTTSATPATVPEVVGSLSATPSDSEVVVSWAVPADDGGSSITGYEYQYSPGGNGWTAVDGGANADSVTVDGLTNGTEYTFAVRAVNSTGQGSASEVKATVPTVPDRVSNLSAAPGNGQATLAWEPPASDGGAPITKYQYGGGPVNTFRDVDGGADARSVIVDSLTNGTEYGFAVRAVNSMGEGTASSVSATPAIPKPGPVQNLLASAGDRSVTLRWDAPLSDGGSPITRYEYQRSGGSWATVSGGASARSKTVSGLTNGTTYTFSVRAVNAVGNGAASSATATPAPATVPGAVANLLATHGDGQVVLSWDAPSSDGFSPITRYEYQRSGGSWATVSGGASARSKTVSGLTNGTTYTFSVRAVNAVGNGAASSATATPMDMIAHYLFNGNARDASGNGYHGTLSGPVSTSDRFGNEASAILFNGTNHRINLPRAVLNGRTNVSVAFWLKTSKTSTQSIISGANRNNENEYLIFFLNQRTVSFYSHGAGPGVNEGRCDVTIPSIADGSWHHIAVIRNDSQGHADIYVDGTGYTNRCRNLVYNRLVIDSGGLIIGQEQDRVGGGFDSSQILRGALDDLRIYGKALSASEVQALSNKRNPKAVATREEPATSGLALNLPNPFNAGTQITYHLATSGPVRLEIYNVLGQPVKTLVEESQTVGSYQIHWDARDQRGAAVATGVYFTRLFYPGGVQVRRLLYLK